MNHKRAKEYAAKIIAYLGIVRVSAVQRRIVTYTIQLAALEGSRETSQQLARAHRRRKGKVTK